MQTIEVISTTLFGWHRGQATYVGRLRCLVGLIGPLSRHFLPCAPKPAFPNAAQRKLIMSVVWVFVV
jgi:hypothetical protein